MINIVIDMMGGDNGNEATIEAVKKFLMNHEDINLILVGDKKTLESFSSLSRVKCVESSSVVAMDVDPLDAIKDKESSLMKAVKELNESNFDCLVSAGSTGGLVAAATLRVGRIKGIKKPGLISSLPTLIKDKKVVVLDLGAFVDDTVEDLYNFAKMGSIFYSINYKKNNPAIYQLNIGTEAHKGREVNQKLFTELSTDKSLNFKGNIEGREVLKGEADVVVTDGYSGNIFLKTTEGTAKMMSSLLKDAFTRNFASKMGYLLSKKGIANMKAMMDYKSVGGAMLLGVKKIVVKAHGSSDSRAFLSALEMSYELKKGEIIEKFEEEFK